MPLPNEQQKFAALVHFLIEECSEPERLGSVRLNKALWFSDVLAYKFMGKPITEAVYVKRKRGPVPQTVLETLRELEREGKIAARKPEFDYDSWKFSSLKPADPDAPVSAGTAYGSARPESSTRTERY